MEPLYRDIVQSLKENIEAWKRAERAAKRIEREYLRRKGEYYASLQRSGHVVRLCNSDIDYHL